VCREVDARDRSNRLGPDGILGNYSAALRKLLAQVRIPPAEADERFHAMPGEPVFAA
jgi:hypothetical protein